MYVVRQLKASAGESVRSKKTRIFKTKIYTLVQVLFTFSFI